MGLAGQNSHLTVGVLPSVNFNIRPNLSMDGGVLQSLVIEDVVVG